MLSQEMVCFLSLKAFRHKPDQGLGKCPQAELSPPAVFIIKVYWNTASPICFRIGCGCLSPPAAELHRCNRDPRWPTDPEIFTVWPVTENVGWPGEKILGIQALYRCKNN